MSLPRFFDRVVDATAPVLGLVDRAAVRSLVADTSVTLMAGGRAVESPARVGFLLAANLLARLYPRIQLDGPSDLVQSAATEISLVNPVADIATGDTTTTATLAYEAVVEDESAVSVSARAWNVHLDADPVDAQRPAAAAALFAAGLGVGEVFRYLAAGHLGRRGRLRRQAGSFNLVTLGSPILTLPVPDEMDIGTVRLVGVGAIGQAAAATLAEARRSGPSSRSTTKPSHSRTSSATCLPAIQT